MLPLTEKGENYLPNMPRVTLKEWEAQGPPGREAGVRATQPQPDSSPAPSPLSHDSVSPPPWYCFLSTPSAWFLSSYILEVLVKVEQLFYDRFLKLNLIKS